jgi:hypothetical protein
LKSSPHEAGSKQICACLVLLLWRRGQNIPLKCLGSFSRLHSVTSQKIVVVLFMGSSARTTNPTNWLMMKVCSELGICILSLVVCLIGFRFQFGTLGCILIQGRGLLQAGFLAVTPFLMLCL